MKTCIDCKTTLKITEFPKNKNKKDGLSLYCKKCCSRRTMECRNRMKIKDPLTGDLIYKRKYPMYKVNSKDYLQDLHLRRTYNITLEEYKKLSSEQADRCIICTRHVSELPTKLSVDHDHSTGKVRGLLCTKCNVGIGYFQDDPNLLKKAIAYLNG